MRTRGFLAILAAVLAVCAWSLPVALAGVVEVRPSALGSLRSGDLVVLAAEQGLFLLSPVTGRVQTVVGGFGQYEAQDTVGAFLDGSDAIFVTMNPRVNRGAGRAQLVRYNAAGVRTGAWLVPRSLVQLGGVAVDEKKKLVYVANRQPAEIYKLDLVRSPRSGTLVRVASVQGADYLGSAVLDAQRGRLLIADPFLGRVFAYDLASGRSESLLEKLGGVSAIALDTSGDRLFIADATGNRVLAADLASKAPAAKLFAQAKEFNELIGVTLNDAGGVWVGDGAQKAVFRLSSSGQLLRAFPLRAAPLRAASSLAPR